MQEIVIVNSFTHFFILNDFSFIPIWNIRLTMLQREQKNERIKRIIAILWCWIMANVKCRKRKVWRNLSFDKFGFFVLSIDPANIFRSFSFPPFPNYQNLVQFLFSFWRWKCIKNEHNIQMVSMLYIFYYENAQLSSTSNCFISCWKKQLLDAKLCCQYSNYNNRRNRRTIDDQRPPCIFPRYSYSFIWSLFWHERGQIVRKCRHEERKSKIEKAISSLCMTTNSSNSLLVFISIIGCLVSMSACGQLRII